jgi:protocatechuate 3,4-dioxygenase beta subunit
MSRVVVAFLTAVALSAVCAAQAPPLPPGFPQPPRDNVSSQPATAVIRGRVFDASNGQPLRKVQVRAFSPELRENRVAITDARGAYEIKNLAEGRYSLSASKGSFVALQYGQTRPFEPGKPLEIRNAQVLEKIDFSLPRGGIITGHIVDETGEPTADVMVQVMRYQYVQGRRQLLPAGRAAQTNDIGEFRLFGIPPGQYVISATLRNIALGESPSDDRSGYAPTYYPGTSNASEAQRLTINVGQTLTDINLALSPTRLARVAGSAVDSQGKPVTTGVLMLMQTGGFGFVTSGGSLKPDGSFSISNVAPGEYTLRLMTNTGPMLTPAVEVLQATITVAGEDITDLHLIGAKPSTVTGRIIAPTSQATNTALSTLQLQVVPKNPMPLGGLGQSHVNNDGTFELLAQPGPSFIRMNPSGSFAGTRIKAVRLNGVDVTDTGIDFRPNEDVSGLEVELTTQLSSLSGLVTDVRGNGVKDYSVVIFARDKERWGPGSRYQNFARPDQDGRYKFTSVTPGDYYAIALDYLEQGVNTDPEFLDRVKERATEFSISDAETKTLDLKLVTGM